MARRRPLTDSGDVGFEDEDAGDRGFGSLFDNGAGFSDAGPNIGSIIEAPPEVGGSPLDGPGPSPALTPEQMQHIQAAQEQGVFDIPVAGNLEGARDIFFGPGRSQQPRGGGGGGGAGAVDVSSLMALVPQGVEAAGDAGAGGGGGAGPASGVAPMQGSAPQSVSMRGTPPANAGTPTPSPQPRRVSSPIIGSSPGAGLYGRSGGLFGGGIGMLGGGSGGPRPTEQMLALLRSLGIGT